MEQDEITLGEEGLDKKNKVVEDNSPEVSKDDKEDVVDSTEKPEVKETEDSEDEFTLSGKKKQEETAETVVVDKEAKEVKEEAVDEVEKTEAPSYSLEDFKKSAEGFETPEDLYTSYQEKVKELEDIKNQEPENVFASEQVKAWNDLMKKGIPLDTIINQLSNDWSAMDTTKPNDALKMIEANVRLSNPDWTEDEIEYKVGKLTFDKEDYKDYLENRYSDDEVIEKKLEKKEKEVSIELSLEAREAKANLIKNQEGLKSQGQTPEEAKKERQEALNSFNEDVNKVTKDFKSINIKVDNEDVEIPVDKDLSKEIKQNVKMAANPETAKQFWEQRGGYAQGLTKMVTAEMTQQLIADEVSKNSIEKGKYEAIKLEKNQKPLTAEKATETRGFDMNKAIADAAAESMN